MTSVAFLLGRDHNSTLSTLKWDPILPVGEKLIFFRLFGIGIEYKDYQHTANYWGSNPSLETCWPSILPTRPPECWFRFHSIAMTPWPLKWGSVNWQNCEPFAFVISNILHLWILCISSVIALKLKVSAERKRERLISSE